LQDRLEELLTSQKPDVVVVETSFAAKFPRSALALAEVRGALLATLGHWGGTVVELEPARVKAAVVGNGRAEKQQVAYVVQRHLGLQATPEPDAADALAHALAFLLLDVP
jgi:crossover junction endodeoxyribonuclease RuvC